MIRPAAIAVLLLAACAPAAGPGAVRPADAPTSITDTGDEYRVNLNKSRSEVALALDAAPDRAWPLLQEVYADLGIQVDRMDAASHTIGNSRISGVRRVAGSWLSAWLNCGWTPLGTAAADAYRVEMAVRTALVPVPGGSEVRSVVSGSARTREGTSNSAVSCSSTGALEARIYQGLARKVEAQRPAQ